MMEVIGMMVAYHSTKSAWIALILVTAALTGAIFMRSSVMAASQGSIAEQPKRVLILNSYHPGMPFSDEEMRGIRTTLPADTAFSIEYMDTKRLRDAGYLSLLREVYAMKYAGKRFDLIFSVHPAGAYF